MNELFSIIRRCKRELGKIDARFRMKPSYLIVGTQKGGTTSLYKYLDQHPKIIAAKKKEIHYFDNDYQNDFYWYINHFPYKKNEVGHITGEASPYYMFHPLVPQRVKQYLPNIKLIFLLRNPIERAFSHYKMQFSRGFEHLTFEEAIRIESYRVSRYEKLMIDGQIDNYKDHQEYSYLSRGLYSSQLERWMKYFDKKQMYIINSESFFYKPEKVLDEILTFLELEDYKFNNLVIHNQGNDIEVNETTRNYLNEFFKPHNENLYKLYGCDFGWK